MTIGYLRIDAGISIPTTTALIETPAASGIFKLDVYTKSNMPSTITIADGIDSEEFTTSACSPCVAIPTLGEWGIICLTLLLLILGVSAIKSNALELNKLD